MTGVSAQILSAAIYCGVSEITIHTLRSNWPGARREGGSVSAAILDRLSNEAPGPFQRNPKGGMSFGRRRCCSLLTDPLRDVLWCPCGSTSRLVLCLLNGWCFVAPSLACGEARGGSIPRSGAVTDEQRSHRPNWAQPIGRQSFRSRLRCSLLADPLRDML